MHVFVTQLHLMIPLYVVRQPMHVGIVYKQDFLSRLPSKQQLRLLRTRKPLAYRESTCMNLSVSCPYTIIVYYMYSYPLLQPPVD